jgi:hypothetical protein
LLCKIRLSSKNPIKTELDKNLEDLPVVLELNDNKAGGKGKQKLIIGEQVITFLF